METTYPQPEEQEYEGPQGTTDVAAERQETSDDETPPYRVGGIEKVQQARVSEIETSFQALASFTGQLPTLVTSPTITKRGCLLE
jgi:hypothetical protein